MPEYRRTPWGWPATCVAALTLAVAVSFSSPSLAQGDGPRAQALLPAGPNIFVPTYLGLTGNFNPAGNILVPGADVSTDVVLVSCMRAFSLGGRYAQIYATPLFGDLSGRGTVAAPGGGPPLTLRAEESGLTISGDTHHTSTYKGRPSVKDAQDRDGGRRNEIERNRPWLRALTGEGWPAPRPFPGV